jgi:hypothetical protein
MALDDEGCTMSTTYVSRNFQLELEDFAFFSPALQVAPLLRWSEIS